MRGIATMDNLVEIEAASARLRQTTISLARTQVEEQAAIMEEMSTLR